jgi:hypothetical protein
MKHKTPTSIFPSPDTWAEKVAERVYYAAPDTAAGAADVIPKTAPVIEEAFGEVLDEIENVCNSRLTDWSQRAANATIMNGGQLQARRAEALEIGDAIRALRKALISTCQAAALRGVQPSPKQ